MKARHLSRLLRGEKFVALSSFFGLPRECPLLLTIAMHFGTTAVSSLKLAFGAGSKSRGSTSWNLPLQQQLYNCCGRQVGYLQLQFACFFFMALRFNTSSFLKIFLPQFSSRFSLFVVLSLSKLRDLSLELCFCPAPSCVCPGFSTSLTPPPHWPVVPPFPSTMLPPPHPFPLAWHPEKQQL